MTITVGSLFSGIGGLDLGLERAGMQVRWQSEIDPYATRVLAKHWPHVPNLGDIKQIDWSTVEHVDLICGGYPCQPFSLAGARNGTEDPRHLWPYFARALRALRPEWALLENVPGHLSLGFDDVQADLAALGYDTEWECIPAAAVGAPHLRWRIFVVAHAQRDELREQPVAERWGSGTSVLGDYGQIGDVGDTEAAERRGTGDTFHPGRWDSQAGRRSLRGVGLQHWLVEPRVCRMADGIPPGLDGGRLSADAEKGGPDQAVRPVRGEDDQDSAGKRAPRGPGDLPETQVLRPDVYGGLATRPRPLSNLPSQVSEADLRTLWHEAAARCASQGRGSDEQLVRELGDLVRQLPHLRTLEDRQAGEADALSYVHGVRQACEALGAMRNPSESLAATWLTLTGEAQEWVHLASGRGRWIAEWPDTPRVASGVPHLVHRLRGLGNAVVPQVAQWIGEQIIASLEVAA